MNRLICSAVLLSAVVCIPASAKSAATRGTQTSKNYDLGKNVKPRYIRESVRPDGSRSVVYGQNKKVSNPEKIGKPHGHSVQNADGKLVYSRTMGGKVLKDDKKK